MPFHARGQAVVLHGGLIYVIGGEVAEELVDGEYYNSGEATRPQDAQVALYDPQTLAWTTRTRMPSPLYVLTAHSLGDAIYVVGGYKHSDGVGFDNVVRRYLPADDTWDARATMPTVRYTFMSELVNDKIFVFGGVGPDDDLTAWPGRTELDIYDPTNDTWSKGASAPFAVANGASCAYEGRIFAFGGEFGNSTLIYDTTTDHWSAGTPPPTARNGQTCVAIGSSFFLLGGRDAAGQELALVERYKAADDSWEPYEPMATGRTWSGATLVGDNVLVFGGLRYLGNSSAANYWGLLDSVETLRAE